MTPRAKAPRTEVSRANADAFEEAHPAAPEVVRPRAPVAGGRSPALVQQSLDRLEREIGQRHAELGRLLVMIAREGFAREAAQRHKKAVAALRKKLIDAHERASKARRALAEIERGGERVPTSRLGRLDAELGPIEADEDRGRRALMAALLAAELAAEEPARRLSVRSADKAAAMALAESETPSSLLSDVTAAWLERDAPAADAPGADAPAVGKSLEGQRRLSALVHGKRRRSR